MARYLYGAAVQGIQDFIFRTNKLREIVGASELVEEICTDKFKELIGSDYVAYDESKGYGSILHAAGNIKYIFNNEDDCKKIVKIFPKEIVVFAPGITVSQAVVKMEGDFANFKKAVNELESRLRTQRNRPMRSATLGMMGILRSRQTGLPIVDERKVKKEMLPVDARTRAKLDMFKHADEPEFELTKSLCNTTFGKEKLLSRQIAYDIEDMTKDNDWVAVIHADGNGLGQIVQAIETDAKKFKEFSESLDKATKAAAVAAYESVKSCFNENKFIPIRPIVLGGDDFTVICRADLALEYVTKFIEQFEWKTNFVRNYNLSFDKLTACAGIAYIKSSYPFYYGYELAETLCSQAKKDAKDKPEIKDGKELPMSCIMFHKVQDSFTEDWKDIAKRELTPQENISFQFGPYYLNKKENRWTVKQLLESANKLDEKEGNAVKSHLRNWLSMLHDNPAMANQKLERLKSAIPSMKDFVKEITFKYDNNGQEYKTPVYDILAIHTINTQKTKED